MIPESLEVEDSKIPILHELRKLFKLIFSKIEFSFPNRLDRDTNLGPLEHQPGMLTNRLPVKYRKGKHEPYYS
jgi:hypothetical protein